MSSVLAVIPARAGSKGIADKNLSELAGRPMVVHSILAALQSAAVERVVVSTDSPQITEISLEHGAEVPFRRPSELSGDTTPASDAVLHAARWLRDREGYRPDWLLMLQPTSPLRGSQDIDAAYSLAIERRVPAVLSVCRVAQHPAWMKRMSSSGKLTSLMAAGEIPTARQILEELFVLNGAIYLGRSETVQQAGTFHLEEAIGYVMPPERSIDIDEPWQLEIAAALLGVAGPTGDDR